MELRYLVIVLLLLILISLGKALFHLSSSKPHDSGKMVRALGWRIGLSILLFVLLIAAGALGLIQPLRLH